MKLALGTVQFGLDYGVSNRRGQVSIEGVQETLSLANDLGIDTLDTAAAYGKSESVLGGNDLSPFNVISKVAPRHGSCKSAKKWIRDSVEASLENLQETSLYALLLHRSDDLLGVDAENVYSELLSLKKLGIVKKIGVSVYTPDEANKIFSKFELDIIQAPMNILDRRMQVSGCLEKLKQRGVEVHIRSAFLQGLLLMEPQKRPSYFAPWEELLSSFDSWVSENKLSRIEACLGFLAFQDTIDKIVVGVESAMQLGELASSVSRVKVKPPKSILSFDNQLINPAFWKL
tara:strand:- start:36519 stop:37382 length:864 start_codon:yes stop_codon:yes gene_type:complete